MARTITAANAVVMLSVSGVFAAPQQLQGFAADDVFDAEAVNPGEVLMGVDGVMSAGFVFVPIPWNITFQADSASSDLFEQWYAAEQTALEKLFATGLVSLATGRKYTMDKGALTAYSPMPDAKKTLQPRKFGITWQRITAAPQ